ncbi:SagB/ThcOx family dehydrogenase [Psychromicrobium sp. YIM B11713]|uniref:SagB/ThcOx family dehydrogenase n=1 Tax=Psychromicrobium sp. YIM B11713 TaxID=3145233 RepID=UPI00374E6D59
MSASSEKILPWMSLDDPAENFHLASKLYRWISDSSSAMYAHDLINDPEALASFGVPSANYPGIERYALGSSRWGSRVSEVLRNRHSAPSFSDAPVSFQDFSTVLRESACVTTSYGRGAPSAGGLYPIDCYLCVNNVQGLPKGFYALAPATAEVHRLPLEQDPRKFLQESLVFQNLAEHSAFHVFFIASMPRLRVKYGQRSYRFALIETGHLAQAMIMCAQESGLASCAVGGFIDQKIDDLLCLDGVEQSVLYSVAFGQPDFPGRTAA